MTDEPHLGVRVVIADDHESQRVLVARVLERIGITDVRFEQSVPGVVDAVTAFDPQLLVMDLHLADGDGSEVLRRLAATDPRWDRRAVLVVTGDTKPETAAELAALRADAILHKPFMIDELIGTVRTLLAGRPASLQPSATRADEGAVTVPDPDPTTSGDHAARLVDVVRELASTQSVDEVVRLVRTAARQLTGADGAAFVLRDGDQCHYVDEDAIGPLWKGKKFPMTACISGWSMLNQQVAVIPDIYVDDRIPHDAYRPTFVRSLVMVPIRTAEPIGAIGNYWAKERVPTDDEVRVLQALADSTAVALQNALLYEQLESVHDRSAELATANDQLRDFVYAVAHDVRSPLSTIQGFADLLYSEDDDQPADTRDALAAIRSSAQSLADYVSDLLAFATADGRELRAELLQLRPLLDEVTGRLTQPIDARRARVVFEGDREIVADRVLVGQALQNLIANAIAYSPPDRDPEVRIGARGHASGWELTVSDNGLGIPPSERESIFEPFRRGSTGAGQSGTGLGLALCRRVAERHGGDISVRDSPAGGAEFVMRARSGDS